MEQQVLLNLNQAHPVLSLPSVSLRLVLINPPIRTFVFQIPLGFLTELCKDFS